MSDARIVELVEAMTLEEQVSLLSGEDIWSLPVVERLKIGKLRVTDGPNGARGGGSLVGGVKSASFPVGIALGATWNPDLVHEIGAALADEVKSKGAHVLLAPTVNMHRSVTNGRNFECYSEDPFLAAQLTVGYVSGLQGAGIATTIKHFAGNESEIERTTINSEVDERALREIYLIPFEAAVKQAGVWAVMSGYNKLNGTYAAENKWLLTSVLRDDWGFDGVVMSDWFGSRTTAPTVNAGLDLEMPGPTRDRGEKLIAAVEAGEVTPEMVRERALNVLRLLVRTGAIDDHRAHKEIADDRPEHQALIRKAGAEAAVLLKNDGLLPLDKSGTGTLALIGPNAQVAQIMGGGSAQLNPHYMISPVDGFTNLLGSDERLLVHPGCTNRRFEPVFKGNLKLEFYDSLDLSGDIVHEGTQEGGQAFWYGEVADGKVDPTRFSVRMTGEFVPEADGTHRVGVFAAGYARIYVDGVLVANAWEDWQPGSTFFEEGCDEVVGEVTLKAGQAAQIVIEFAIKPSRSLIFAALQVGIGHPMGRAEIVEAAEMAAQAEMALVFVGRDGEWDTEGWDLPHMVLPGLQNDLVEAVAAVNPKTIVVLQTGGPIEMPWLDKVAGVIEAWYPGQEAGNAIADVIFGDAEPTGRLPQSFPRQWADNPTHSQDKQVYPGLDGTVRYEEGVFTGYRHYDKTGIAPLFPFGFGLGYADFEMSGFAAELTGEGADLKAQVNVGLRNISKRAGSTVVQIYVRPIDSPIARPDKELKAFKKLSLDANDGLTVSLELDARAFAFFDVEASGWKIAEGDYEVLAGFSATDIIASQRVSIASDHMLPR